MCLSQNSKQGIVRKTAGGGSSSRPAGPPRLLCPLTSLSSCPGSFLLSTTKKLFTTVAKANILQPLFFHRRLSFTLLDLLCNKYGSPPSPFNWSVPEQGHSPGICTPGELLLAGPCACVLVCCVLLEKPLNEQIQQIKICIRSICRNCKGFVMCLENKPTTTTWLWAKQADKANTAWEIAIQAIQVRKSWFSGKIFRTKIALPPA